MTCIKFLIIISVVGSAVFLVTFLTKMPKDTIYYRAAVLEAVPFMDPALPISTNVQRNLETFEIAINLVKSHDVDIIVFQENVLYKNINAHAADRKVLIGSIAEDIPNPKEQDYNPCEQVEVFRHRPILRKLSCLARKGGLFLVANVADYKKCAGVKSADINATSNCSDDRECPIDGYYFYNTNVVFNRDGKLVARYYKKHLFFEKAFNPSKCSGDGYFETDFGKFITIVCFDLVHKEVVETLEKTQVVNLAYPYNWYDFTPYIYFAPAFQQSFAVFTNINLIGANGHIPGSGSVGSGIFSGSNGALIYTHQPDGHTRLLISNVPKDPKKSELNFQDLNRRRFVLENGSFYDESLEDKLMYKNECKTEIDGIVPNAISKTYQCFPVGTNSYTFKKLTDSEGDVEVCSEGLCCSLSYNAQSMEEDYFLAVSNTDMEVFSALSYGVESCFLTHCKSEDGKSCSSYDLKSKTVFQKAELKGNFDTKYVYPYTLDSHIRLTKKDQWTFDGRSQIIYNNLNTNSSLLFLGLYGRHYERDGFIQCFSSVSNPRTASSFLRLLKNACERDTNNSYCRKI